MSIRRTLRTVKVGNDIDGYPISVKSKSARFSQEVFPQKESLRSQRFHRWVHRGKKKPCYPSRTAGLHQFNTFLYKDYSFHDPCGPWKRLQRYEEKSEKPSNFEYLIFFPVSLSPLFPAIPSLVHHHEKKKPSAPSYQRKPKASFYS